MLVRGHLFYTQALTVIVVFYYMYFIERGLGEKQSKRITFKQKKKG